MKSIKELIEKYLAWKETTGWKFTIACLIVCILLLGWWGVILLANEANKDRYNSYTTYEIFTEINALRYDSIKLALSEEVDRYIQNSSNNLSALDGLLVVNKCIEYDIDVCFVLAQGEQESHFGTQGLARKTNSVFNVYAYDGHEYNKINPNGKYAHPNDCVEPYLRLLKRDYFVNGKTEFDMLVEYTNKDGKRYASSETYEQALFDKVNKLKNTTKIDILYQTLKKQALIVGL